MLDTRSAVGAVALVCLLSGCSSPSEQGATTVSPLEAKAELYSLIDMVKQYHDGEWEISDSGALPCVTDDGEPGAQYLYLITADGLAGDGQEPVLDAMSAAWTEAGFEPARSVRPAVNGIVVTDLSYPTRGTGQTPTGWCYSSRLGRTP